ncbi:MAG: DUF2029 domain-containing protein [Anaerolineaceae bacterium]|nr:DUF2029 domain-containing protein [Anaerolineaceae bacterium]
MNASPLRKLITLRPSILLVSIAVIVVLIVPNVLFTLNTDYGSSFYSYWLTGRVLFAQGQNPYGDELFEQVRLRFPTDTNLSGFSLPIYAIIPVLPFTFINNFPIALILWRLLLEAALFYAAFRLLRGFRIQNKLTPGLVCAAFLLLNYYSISALTDGDISILAITFFLVGLAAMQEGEAELSGIMFAFSTIKCSLTLLPVLWVCIWALSHRGGGIIVAWTGMVLALLFLVGMLLRTDWFMLYLRSMVYYLKYMNPTNISKLIENWQPELGGRIGWAISGVFILILIIEWIINAQKDVNALEWVLALTLTVGFLVGIPNIGKHLFILWIPALYDIDKMQLRWGKKGLIYGIILVVYLLVLPWIFQLFVFPDWKNPVNMFSIISPLILVFLLFWNRWWIIDTYIEQY